MTYYNCAKFHGHSIFNFGVSRGSKLPPLGTNVSKNILGFLGLSSHLVQRFLVMLLGDLEDSD